MMDGKDFGKGARREGIDRVENRLLKQSEGRRLKHEVERVCREGKGEVRGLERTRQELARTDRLSERSNMRRLKDFDPRREMRLENLEIDRNPEGYLRRHLGEGRDAATDRRVRAGLEKLGLCDRGVEARKRKA